MQTIYLDISNKGVIPCIQAKQSEVGRKFLAVITDNGVPYNIPIDSLLSVWYEGDTDAGNYSSIEAKSAFTIDGNKVAVELVAQMLLKPGNGELCLSITHGDGGETNTWNIPYCVEYKPGAGSAVPTEYYTALTEAGAAAAQAVGEAKTAATEAKVAAEEAKETVLGYLKADGTVPMTGALNMDGNKVRGVAKPTDGSDAVNLEFVTALAKVLVPVGYIFQWDPVADSGVDLSTPEKVANHFGFGTWEQIKDTFILAAGDDYIASTTGGNASHTLTVEEMPSHTHGVDFWSRDAGDAGFDENYTPATLFQYWNRPTERRYAETASSGENQPFSIMPPYKCVYVWKRIA